MLPVADDVTSDVFSDGYILRKMLNGQINLIQANMNLDYFL